jgi:outer membrane protein assembly factor BamD
MDSYAFKKRYNTAMSDVKAEQYEAGITTLKQLEQDADTPTDSMQVAYGLAYAYYKSENFDEAIKRCDLLIRQHSNKPDMEYAHYLRALAATSKGDKQMLALLSSVPPNKSESAEDLRIAYDYFARTLQLFPKGKYAEDVIRQMSRIRKKLAEYEINVIRSDMMEQNYSEATRRANYVVEYYSDTPAHMKALELLIKSYKSQGDPRQAELANKKLKQLQDAEQEKVGNLIY